MAVNANKPNSFSEKPNTFFRTGSLWLLVSSIRSRQEHSPAVASNHLLPIGTLSISILSIIGQLYCPFNIQRHVSSAFIQIKLSVLTNYTKLRLITASSFERQCRGNKVWFGNNTLYRRQYKVSENFIPPTGKFTGILCLHSIRHLLCLLVFGRYITIT